MSVDTVVEEVRRGLFHITGQMKFRGWERGWGVGVMGSNPDEGVNINVITNH